MSSFNVPKFDDYGGFDELGSYDAGSARLTGWALKGNRPPAQQPASGAAGGFTSAAATNTNSGQLANATAMGLGVLASAYSKFAQVQMAQIETRSAADFQRFRGQTLALDVRSALRAAEGIVQQGRTEASARGLEGEQRRAAITAEMAAQGLEAGPGNQADVLVAEATIEAIDVYNINLNTVRAANQARAQAVNLRNEQRFAAVSERNLRRTARYAQPEAQLVAGLAGGLSSGFAAGGIN